MKLGQDMNTLGRTIRRQAHGPDGYVIVQNRLGTIEIRHGSHWIEKADVMDHMRRINRLARLGLPLDAERGIRHTVRSLGSTIISVLNARATA